MASNPRERLRTLQASGALPKAAAERWTGVDFFALASSLFIVAIISGFVGEMLQSLIDYGGAGYFVAASLCWAASAGAAIWALATALVACIRLGVERPRPACADRGLLKQPY